MTQSGQSASTKKPISVERLLEWAFADEKAKLDPMVGTGRVEIPKHLGYGSMQHALLQMSMLGVRIDVSRSGASFVASDAPHWDAEAVAAVVAGHLDARAAQLVASCAAGRTRPTAMVGSVPALEPEEWHNNPHAKTAKTVDAKPLAFPGGVWRAWMDEARKSKKAASRFDLTTTELREDMRRHLGRCTPVVYRPHPSQIRSARLIYRTWWDALHVVRLVLTEGSGLLRAHVLIGQMPPPWPWLKPGEAEVVEIGSFDWRAS